MFERTSSAMILTAKSNIKSGKTKAEFVASVYPEHREEAGRAYVLAQKLLDDEKKKPKKHRLI